MATTALKVDPQFRSWRPDGLAWSQRSKSVFLLEFTRCSDTRNSPTPQAIERKEMKYQPLLESIRTLNTDLNVTLVTFATGYLGSLDQTQFQSNLSSLGVDPKHHDTIRRTTISATLSSFAKMASERLIAHNTMSPKQPIRPWEGVHRPFKTRRKPPQH
jgi:hypothetical protein